MPSILNIHSLKDLDRVTFLTFESAHLNLSEGKVFKVTRVSLEDLSGESLKARLAAQELAYFFDEVLYFQKNAAEKLKERKIEQIEIHSEEGKIETIAAETIKIEGVSQEELQALIDKCCEVASRVFSEKTVAKSKPLSKSQVILLHSQEQASRLGVIKYFIQQYSAIIAKIIKSFREDREQQKAFQKEQNLRERLLEERLKYARKQEGIKIEQIESQQKIQEIAKTAGKLSSLFSRGKSSK